MIELAAAVVIKGKRLIRGRPEVVAADAVTWITLGIDRYESAATVHKDWDSGGNVG
jgi:hypothetical protein